MLQAGAADRGRLSLFLNQVEKTDDKSVFGFRSVGLWLGTVADADKWSRGIVAKGRAHLATLAAQF